ncbi:unnamed protein product [Echinostoma caproni]|uniref:Uncharacterized protein n=1 Tax=Echinostoma caproni TaxID=27848 RepID=A0A183AFG5_9TREM|nr:unnamed protein product [Echinostoma caproni]
MLCPRLAAPNTPDTEKSDTKPHPRSEAFVIDFGPSGGSVGESRGPVPGSLSQCVPDRLRRGFDERERLKREREKENELRRQTMPSVTSPMRQNSQRSTRSVTLRAANAKLTAAAATSGRQSTSLSGLNRGGRVSSTRPNTATPGSSSRGLVGQTGRPTPLNHTVQSGRANSSGNRTPRRATGSVPTSPLVRISKTPGVQFANVHEHCSTSVTPGQPNLSATRKVVDGAISRVSALQAVTTRTGLTAGRRPTVGSNAPGTPRKLSQGTDRSIASRRTAPPGTIKPTGTTVTKSGLNVAPRSVTTVNKPATTVNKTRGGLQAREPPTRSFMSATASSGAKRVQPHVSSRPPTGNAVHSQPRSPAVTCGPTLGNSIKRPVTSTQLRRPASSTRVTARRSYTDLADKRGPIPSRGGLTRMMSEVTANVMATIEAYDDPKAYLFYRMFQGADEAEPSTDSVFKTFTSESPSRSAGAKRGATIGAIPQGELDAAMIQTDWLQEYREKENLVEQAKPTSPNVRSPSTAQLGLDGASLPFSNAMPSNLPEAGETELDAEDLLDVTQPTVSASSPKIQHRQLPSATENQVNVSMLVGTSVTSLAGTYILEKGTTLNEREAVDNTGGVEMRTAAVSSNRLREPGSADQLHSRGNLTRLQEMEEEQNIVDPSSPRKSPVHAFLFGNGRKSTMDLLFADSSSYVINVTRVPCDPTGPRLKRRTPNDPPDLTASTDLPTTSSDVRIARTGNVTSSTTQSSEALLEACKDDMELDKTEAPVLSADGLNTSVLVSASVTSLAPSLAGTYVMDVDDTLAAKGLVPAVVVQSREDLLLSPTREIRLLGNRMISRGSRLAEVSKESSLTPRASPAPNRDGLWDVLETEECTEEVENGNLSPNDGTLSRPRRAEVDGLVAETVEEMECYRSLPNPSDDRDRIYAYQVGLCWIA